MKILRIIPVLLSIFVFSCTEEIDVDLGNTFTRLIVYGEINTDTKAHSVRLTRSADYFYNQPPGPVSDALVQISFDDTLILLSENPQKPGYYETEDDFRGIQGKTYHLSIENVDVNDDGITEEYQASSYLPFSSPLDSITLNYVSNTFFSGWEVKVWAWDPLEVRNYYSFKVRKNGVMLTDTLNELIVQSDDFFNGNYTFGITSQFVDDSNPTEKAVPGDTIEFQLEGITKEYYVFILEAQAESFGSNPLFSGPPANTVSNISNGALGFFTAYSIERARAVIPDPEE